MGLGAERPLASRRCRVMPQLKCNSLQRCEQAFVGIECRTPQMARRVLIGAWAGSGA